MSKIIPRLDKNNWTLSLLIMVIAIQQFFQSE
jgi:hypothetical protein